MYNLQSIIVTASHSFEIGRIVDQMSFKSQNIDPEEYEYIKHVVGINAKEMFWTCKNRKKCDNVMTKRLENIAFCVDLYVLCLH